MTPLTHSDARRFARWLVDNGARNVAVVTPYDPTTRAELSPYVSFARSAYGMIRTLSFTENFEAEKEAILRVAPPASSETGKP